MRLTVEHIIFIDLQIYYTSESTSYCSQLIEQRSDPFAVRHSNEINHKRFITNRKWKLTLKNFSTTPEAFLKSYEAIFVMKKSVLLQNLKNSYVMINTGIYFFINRFLAWQGKIWQKRNKSEFLVCCLTKKQGWLSYNRLVNSWTQSMPSLD